MPEQITTEMLRDFHHTVEENIFEYMPDEYCNAFGDFLIQQYPQFKNEIEEVQANDGDYFEFSEIDHSFNDAVASAYNATVLHLEFIKFCNTNDECRQEVLEIMANHMAAMSESE